MSTIDDKQVIFDLIRQNGHYDDDPQVAIIFSYTNDWGKSTNAIYYQNPNLTRQVTEFMYSPTVHDPKILWTSDRKLTQAGQIWLEAYKNLICGGSK